MLGNSASKKKKKCLSVSVHLQQDKVDSEFLGGIVFTKLVVESSHSEV